MQLLVAANPDPGRRRACPGVIEQTSNRMGPTSMSVTRNLTVLTCLFALAPVLRGADAPDPTLPKVPESWKVELIANAPQIQHPSVVCCAPDGRIFVGEDPVDMHLPSSAEADRILCF